MIHKSALSPDDQCEFDNGQFNDIILLGRVVAMYEENMKTNMVIEDSTGVQTVNFYQKGDNQVAAPLKNFTYTREKDQWVRVYAIIRIYNEQKYVVGISLNEVEKMDEVTNHFLQIFVNHNIRNKGVLSNEDLQTQKIQAPTQSRATLENDNQQSEMIIKIMKEIN
mmetsp:Transcript_16234/g.27459  ORF Transcript_16234/g.27459 Transcript_16234/m.27459 type:complete len:166 (-) Transcript_16234:225-722(-)|eukprot:CAMPEP_0168616216 /NCGR_PEP_ID=MMETSP0449_2-20121227/4915_1 /TAXON_ID=1082188 /ORGANISM="Strombidium rassoulzadegani, Strain ras09" /LENGTH=165 /DNA_ID=CAMNT_0008656999 /DNA_START=152 /DNA_END=649 /DNA_ORIENTATION=+